MTPTPTDPYTADAYAAYWSTVEATPAADAGQQPSSPPADARDPYAQFYDVAEL